MPKPIHAFFDVDRTIRKGSAALDFCTYLAQNHIVSPSFIENDTKVREEYQAGHIDYHQMVEGVVTIHASVLSGLDEATLSKHFTGYIQSKPAFFDWTENLFTILNQQHIHTTLVSAGIYPAIAAIAEHLHATQVFTSTLEISHGIYTGKITHILHDSNKEALIQKYLQDQPDDIVKIGFGDSTGDVSMLKLMDHVFVIDPHQPEMIDLAHQNHWQIIKPIDDILSKVDKILNKHELRS